MRILALITDGFGGYGGIAQYNRDLLTAIARCDGIEEVVLLPRYFWNSNDVPDRVTRIRSPKSKILYSTNAVRVALSQRAFGAIFCGHVNMAPLAALLAKLTGAPLWIQVHGIEAWENQKKGVRRGIESAALITSVSRFTKQRLLSWVDLEQSRVKVLPNTFNAAFKRGSKSTDLLKRYGLEGKSVLLTVSRLAEVERKGHDLVIRQLGQILLECPNTVYLIVGEGAGRPALERLVAECGVADAVRFLGRIPKSDLPELMRLADVFVMPSLGEGFGIVFLEAIASGIQVVAGNKDGSVDPLCDGAAGFVVDPLDGRALSTAVIDALRKPSAKHAFAERFSRPHFEKHVGEIVDACFLRRKPA